MNFDCTDSEKFYELNRILGLKEETSTEEITSNALGPLSSQENAKSKSTQKLSDKISIRENVSHRIGVPTHSGTHHSNRISTPTVATARNQIVKKTTISPFIGVSNTDRISQTTNFRESTGETTLKEFIASTTFPPVNIAEFFEITTRRPFTFPTTMLGANTEFITATSNAATDMEQPTTKGNFIPDLYEPNGQSTADEIVDSIKQLQSLFPSNADDDSREKRVLFKAADSVQNRQKLFEMLNHHLN